MLATIVDTSALLKVVVYSLVLGVGVTLAFSLSIVGAARFVEMQRDRRRVAAGFFGVLSAVGLAISAAAIVLGIVEVTAK